MLFDLFIKKIFFSKKAVPFIPSDDITAEHSTELFTTVKGEQRARRIWLQTLMNHD